MKVGINVHFQHSFFSSGSSTVAFSLAAALKQLGHTPVPLAMFDETKFQDTFKSYRFYYIVYKRKFAKWTRRSPPWWYTSGNFKLLI